MTKDTRPPPPPGTLLQKFKGKLTALVISVGHKERNKPSYVTNAAGVSYPNSSIMSSDGKLTSGRLSYVMTLDGQELWRLNSPGTSMCQWAYPPKKT